jgi:hypothetical protein
MLIDPERGRGRREGAETCLKHGISDADLLRLEEPDQASYVMRAWVETQSKEKPPPVKAGVF